MNDEYLEEKFGNLQRTIDDGFQRVESQIKEVSKRMDKTDGIVRDHGERIVGIEHVISSHREKIEKVDKRIDQEKTDTYRALTLRNGSIALAFSIVFFVLTKVW